MAHKKTMSLVEDFNNIPEEALVPEAEQPYPIPAHWKWVRIGCIASASKKKTDVFSGDQHYLGLENLESGGGLSSISSVDGIKSSKSIFTAGQILYGRLRPYLDKHIVADFDGVCSTDILVYETSSILNAHYFDFWLSTSTFRNAAVSQSKGINLPRISESAISQFPFPLPPIDEQREIIAYLEANLAKIDQVTEKFEIFLESSEKRVESLLEAAVQGYLTEDWRNQNDYNRDEWKRTTLGEAFKWSSGGTPSRKYPDYFTGSIPWVKSGELLDSIVDDTEEHVTEEAIKNSSAKIFHQGSVAIAMYGATIGRVGILGIDAATNQAIAVAQTAEHTLVRYLFFYLRANRTRFIALGKGGAQPNISQRIIRAFPYEYPDIAEQEKILQLVDLNLDALSSVESMVEEALENLRVSRQSFVSAALAGQFNIKTNAL